MRGLFAALVAILVCACAPSPSVLKGDLGITERRASGPISVLVRTHGFLTEYRINPENDAVVAISLAPDGAPWDLEGLAARERRRIGDRLGGYVQANEDPILRRASAHLLRLPKDPDARSYFQDYRQPAERSPDGTQLAVALVKHGDYVAHALAVIDAKSAVPLSQRSLEDRYVTDMTWSPDGLSLAVVSTSERFGLLPWELLAAVAGHPVPYNTIYVDIIRVRDGDTRSFKLATVTYGTGRILWE